MSFRLIQSLLLCCAASWSSTATAAECPQDQQGMDVRAPGPTETIGEESASLLGHVLLGQGIHDRMLRLRRITLSPGAQVGWHEHRDRSLLFLIESGAMTEYRSDCRVPIQHETGSTIEETIGTKHWWRNEGSIPAVMILADITAPDAVNQLNLPSGKPAGAKDD